MHTKRLKNFFRASDVDALVIRNGDSESSFDPNYFYYTGLELDNSVLVAKRGARPVLLCSPLNYEHAKAHTTGAEVRKIERAAPGSVLKKLLAGCGSVGVNKGALRVSTYEGMRKSGLTFVDVSGALEAARTLKEGSEISLMKKCARKTRELLDSVEVRVGMREEKILKNLRIAALESGADISFPPIVLSGPKTRVPHGVSGRRKVGLNEVVLIDFGLRLNGYCSDLTRCYFTGACKKEKLIYEKLKKVHKGLASYAKHGLEIAKFVKRSESLMRKYGLPNMPHSVGHGIGLEVHEQPLLMQKSKDRLASGMVVAIEPAYYGKKFGLRYEDDLMIRKGKALLL